MADDTNIDEILKSIDALLKDNEDDISRDGDDKRHRQATNDEEVSPDIEADATDLSDGTLEARPCDEHQAEQEPNEQHELEHHQAELQQAGDAADMDDHPTNLPLAEDAGEDIGQSEVKTAVRRIMLSEAMVVEDAPDLSPEVAESEIASGESQPEGGAFGDVDSDEADADLIVVGENEDEVDHPDAFQESEDSAATMSSESEEHNEPVVDPSELDMAELIEQITSEISARLQQQLPGMVAGMVAEAMQNNLAVRAATDDESTDDTQN